MADRMTAIFTSEELAYATIQMLMNLGLDHHIKVLNEINPLQCQDKQYLQHKLNQGATILTIDVPDENWITIYEVIHSYAGETYSQISETEVINSMYNIPEDELKQVNGDLNQYEVGTYGYPYDQLDDDAYIDPNIGIGNYDLLIPFIEEQKNEDNH